MPTQEELNRRFVYDSESGALSYKISAGHRRPGDRAGTRHANGGFAVEINKAAYLVHRIIWQMHYGSIPPGLVIDHIDGNPKNNRLSNLRAVTQVINGRNCKRKKTNRSGVNGVYYRKDKRAWCAEMHVSGRHIHLGYFKNFDDAVAARLEANPAYGFHPNHGRVVE